MGGSERQISAPAMPPRFARIGRGATLHRLAFLKRPARGRQKAPGLVWLGGFRSDMRATKAEALDALAARTGRALLRFDYSAHGESEGDFATCTIGQWLADALHMIRTHSVGPQILVGSSMGGWIALLAARALDAAGEGARLAGLVLIAPAVDFTHALMAPQLPPDAVHAIETQGHWMRPSGYGPERYPITKRLMDESRDHLLFGGVIRAFAPVHILQGMQDPDVPWSHAVRLVESMPADPVALTLIRDGDHRLSRADDIERLIQAIEGLH